MSTSTFLIIMIATGAICALFGVYLFVKTRRAVRLGEASLAWPQVPGEILTSSIRTHVTSTEDGDTVSYEPVVTYRYMVSERILSGTRVAFRQMTTNSEKRANAVLQKYPSGSRVVVRFDPGKPEAAVLEAGTDGVKIGYVWSAVMMAVAVAVTTFGISWSTFSP